LITDCEGEDVNILLSTDFSNFRPKYIFSETTFLFYCKGYEGRKDRKLITEEVYTKLTNHMKKFNYKLIFSNDMIDYKKKYFPELLGYPMNCCWELQLEKDEEENTLL